MAAKFAAHIVNDNCPKISHYIFEAAGPAAAGQRPKVILPEARQRGPQEEGPPAWSG